MFLHIGYALVKSVSGKYVEKCVLILVLVVIVSPVAVHDGSEKLNLFKVKVGVSVCNLAQQDPDNVIVFLAICDFK
jgi:hypothetical protein